MREVAGEGVCGRGKRMVGCARYIRGRISEFIGINLN